MKKVIFLAVLCLLVLAAAPRGGALDWPRWRGPDGSGVSKEVVDPAALSGGAKVLWTADIGAGYSSVAIVDGRLYTAGKMGKEPAVLCLDAATGGLLWKKEIADAGPPQSTPAVDGDRVYLLGAAMGVFCLRTADGEVLWQRNLLRDFKIHWPVYQHAASAVVAGPLLLINASGSDMAFDKLTGDLAWSVPDPVPAKSFGSFATPVACEVDGRSAALFLGPSHLTAIDRETGKPLWSFAHGETLHPVADPIVSDGSVFYSVPVRCGLLSLSGGAPGAWEGTQMETWLCGPVLAGGKLYGVSLPDGYTASSWGGVEGQPPLLRCVDWATGKVLWENSMPYVSVTAAGDKLLLLDLKGTLRIAEASLDGYRELASADVLRGAKRPHTFATPPVLCNGLIYCRNFAGDLVCIDVSVSQ
jgi:outer membrane protein assembly factor BamB